MQKHIFLIAAAAVALAGCKGGESGTAPCALEIAVSPPAVTLETGESAGLTATTTGVDGCGSVTTGWSSLDPSVAEVSGAGVVTGGTPGVTSVTAVAEASGRTAMSSATITVVEPPGMLSVAPREIRFGFLGQEAVLMPVHLDAGGAPTDAEIQFSSDDPGIVTVSAEGVVTAMGEGVTRIVVETGPLEFEVPVSVTEAFTAVATFNLTTYALTADAMSWPDAVTLAREYGGHLVVINFQGENDFLSQRYQLQPGGGLANLWIGLGMDGAAFSWADDRPLQFERFQAGEPSGDGACVHFAQEAGRWNDIPCSNVFRAIVEFPHRDSRIAFSDSYVHQGGHYLVTQWGMSWVIARNVAEALGGHLAIVETPEETQQPGLTNVLNWIGLSDRDVEGTFRWVDGRVATYLPWGPNDPGGDSEDCVIGLNQRWVTTPCHFSQRAVFEFR